MLFIVIFAFGSFSLIGQDKDNAREDFLYGEFYFSLGMYPEALNFYLASFDLLPENSNINYRIALCYAQSLSEQKMVLPYLQRSVKEISLNYLEGNFNETGAPPSAWLLLGDAYLHENQLKNASYAYQQYKDLLSSADTEKLDIVNKKIEGVETSFEYQRTHKPYKLVNLSNTINSRFSDYNPVVSADQKTLVYTQFWETTDRILISYKKDSLWSEPKFLDDSIGAKGGCYTSAISADGNELYIVRYGEMASDIYMAKKINGKWQKMKPIKGKVNSNYRESSVCISADHKTLYFSSDRPGGEGGMDLYQATYNKGKWTNIFNLGKTINSPGNEVAPQVILEGERLYFSSNGYKSVGNMDIFYSEKKMEIDWQSPVNLGFPVNTTADELYFVYFKEDSIGYIAKNITGGYGKNDLYALYIGNDSILQIDMGTNSDIEMTAQTFDLFFKTDTNRISEENLENNYYSLGQINFSEPENSNSGESGFTFVEIANDSIVYENNKNAKVITVNSNQESVNDVASSTMALEKKNHDKYELGFNDSISTYTIQIMALLNPVKSTHFKLHPIQISTGIDGLYRYTYGEFMGYSKALSQLQSIRNSGFPDAFIRNINLINNYGSGLKNK